MKRSIAPIFWLLFGAGGMLAALTGPALVLITGLAAPTGIGVSPSFMSFARATAFAEHPLGKLFLFGVIALFVWHGAEERSFEQVLFQWLPVGGLQVDVGFLVDPLSITMAL